MTDPRLRSEISAWKDWVVAVDGRRTANGQEVQRLVEAHDVGDRVTFTLRRSGAERELVVTLGTLPARDVIAFVLPSLAGGWIYLTLGILAYRKAGPGRATRINLAFCLTSGLLTLSFVSTATAHSLDLLERPLWLAANVATFGLGGLFLSERAWRPFRTLWAVHGSGAMLTVLAVLAVRDPRWLYEWAPHVILLVITPVGVLGMLAGLGWTAFRAEARSRQQARLVLGGVVLVVLAVGTWTWAVYWGYVRGEPIPEVYYLLIVATPAIFPSVIVYAIVRHQLFDVQVFIRRTLLYTSLTLALVSLFFAGTTLLNVALLSWFDVGGTLATVLTCAALSFAVSPVRRGLQLAIDRAFFRERLDRERFVASFASRVVTEPDFSRVKDELLKALEAVCRPRGIGLWVLDPSQGGLVCVAPDGERDLDAQELARQFPEPAWELSADAGGVAAVLANLGFAVTLPLRLRDQVIGLIALGPRRSDLPYATYDRHLLVRLADETTLALHHSLLLREKERDIADLEQIVAERTRTLAEAKRRTEEQAAKLRELDEVKSRFFANISHELRTPLTLILGPLEGALEDADADTPHPKLPASLRRPLERSLASARRLLRLVHQLLDLSKIEAGQMRLAPRRMDVVPFLERIVDAFHSLAEGRRVGLGLSVGENPLHLDADADKLEQVFANLVSNALKFTPAGGHVEVRLRGTTPDAIEVAVTDTGCGIPGEELPRLFDRFYQVAGAPHAGSGTGIGLALTQELVTLHGGEIQVTSEPGRGSTFTVRLPRHSTAVIAEGGSATPEAAVSQRTELEVAAAEDLSVAEPMSVSPEGPAQGEHRPLVIVVEDHSGLREYVTECLSGEYRVSGAPDGQAGLELARELEPDLVLSDVMMPGMDGMALCRAIKTDPDLDHIPVVLLTARAELSDKLDALELGADDYLPKPFNRRELLARVRNLIQIRQGLRQRFQHKGVIQLSSVAATPQDQAFLQRAAGVVESRVADPTFGMPELSSALGMSPRSLQRKLKALTGETPHFFIQALRLQRAAQLLEQKAGGVSEVAYTVGFEDPAHFSKAFRRQFGVPPSQYGH